MHASLNRSNSISECTVHTHTFDFCVWVLCSFFPVREISMFLAWGWCEAFCSSLSHSNCNVCRIQVFRPVNVFHCAVINQIESLPTHLFKYRNVDAFIHIYIYGTFVSFPTCHWTQLWCLISLSELDLCSYLTFNGIFIQFLFHFEKVFKLNMQECFRLKQK